MLQVVVLGKHRNKKLIAGLKELLALAESGDLRSLAVIGEFGPRDHRAFVLGGYKDNPERALQATFLMERALMKGKPPFESSM